MYSEAQRSEESDILYQRSNYLVCSNPGTANSAPNQRRTDRQQGSWLSPNQVVPMKEVYRVQERTCSRVMAFRTIKVFQVDESGQDAFTIGEDWKTCH